MLEIFFTRDSWKYTWDFFVLLQSLLSLMSPFLSSSLLGKPPPQCSRAVFKNQPTVCLLFLLQPFTPHEIFLGNTRERRNTNRGSVGNSRAERIHVLLSVRRYSTSFNHIFCFKRHIFLLSSNLLFWKQTGIKRSPTEHVRKQLHMFTQVWQKSQKIVHSTHQTSRALSSLSTLKCVLMIVQQQYQSVRGLPDAAQTKQKSHISLHTFWPAPRNKESKSESNREPGVLRVLLQWGGSEASLGGTACSQRAKIPSASHRTSDRTWTSTVTTTHTHWSVSLIRFRWDDQAAPPQVSELL